VLPITEPKTVVVWTTAKINNEGQNQKSDYGDDLDAGKNELGFAIDLNGKDVQAEDQYNDD
jgi:hypothetical protein